MIRQKVDESFASVGAREDIDGCVPLVVLCPNRQKDDAERIELTMEPKTARALARRLNRWARMVSS